MYDMMSTPLERPKSQKLTHYLRFQTSFWIDKSITILVGVALGSLIVTFDVALVVMIHGSDHRCP
jgi:hypothetical protein